VRDTHKHVINDLVICYIEHVSPF